MMANDSVAPCRGFWRSGSQYPEFRYAPLRALGPAHLPVLSRVGYECCHTLAANGHRVLSAFSAGGAKDDSPEGSVSLAQLRGTPVRQSNP